MTIEERELYKKLLRRSANEFAKAILFYMSRSNYDNYEKKSNAMNVIDPVNDYILKKNYTAKFKKSASDKKKEVIQKEKELKKKKKEMVVKENNASLTISSDALQKDKNEDNIITEEIISLTNDKADNVVQSDNKHSNANDNDVNDDDNDEEQLLEENDDDDDDEGNEEDDELNEIANEESDEDDYDYDYEYGIIPEEFEMSEEEEVTPENIQIQKALKNSQRNQKVDNQSYKKFLGKKKHNSINDDKDMKNGNKLKKRKIKYVLEHNITHVYDRKKPIMLTSNKKNVIPKNDNGNAAIKKSLLKSKK
jgi:hypothetical protein